MAEPVPEPVTEPAEARGGDRPDWESTRPGEPLTEISPEIPLPAGENA